MVPNEHAVKRNKEQKKPHSLHKFPTHSDLCSCTMTVVL